MQGHSQDLLVHNARTAACADESLAAKLCRGNTDTRKADDEGRGVLPALGDDDDWRLNLDVQDTALGRACANHVASTLLAFVEGSHGVRAQLADWGCSGQRANRGEHCRRRVLHDVHPGFMHVHNLKRVQRGGHASIVRCELCISVVGAGDDVKGKQNVRLCAALSAQQCRVG